MQTLKYFLLTLLFIIFVSFFVGGLSLALNGTFLPWQEKVRRQTFEQSQSYVHGKISYLNRLRMQYQAADSPAQKCAIRATALHEAALATTLPQDLKAWIMYLENTSC